MPIALSHFGIAMGDGEGNAVPVWNEEVAALMSPATLPAGLSPSSWHRCTESARVVATWRASQLRAVLTCTLRRWNEQAKLSIQRRARRGVVDMRSVLWV